jgi:hypothetical protein
MAPLHALRSLRKLSLRGRLRADPVQVGLHPISRLECLQTLDIRTSVIDDARPAQLAAGAAAGLGVLNHMGQR